MRRLRFVITEIQNPDGSPAMLRKVVDAQTGEVFEGYVDAKLVSDGPNHQLILVVNRFDMSTLSCVSEPQLDVPPPGGGSGGN